jgi:hypothetical protein
MRRKWLGGRGEGERVDSGSSLLKLELSLKILPLLEKRDQHQLMSFLYKKLVY